MLNMQTNMQNNSSLFIFCIFSILQYAEYEEYAMIWLLHILHFASHCCIFSSNFCTFSKIWSDLSIWLVQGFNEISISCCFLRDFPEPAFIQEVCLNPSWCCDVHVLFVISALGRSRRPVQVHELYISNMQNMSNMKNMSNTQNILNMDKLSLKANLVHEIVYLRSLLLVLGVMKDGSSSSSVSSTCAGPSLRTRSRLGDLGGDNLKI